MDFLVSHCHETHKNCKITKKKWRNKVVDEEKQGYVKLQPPTQSPGLIFH